MSEATLKHHTKNVVPLGITSFAAIVATTALGLADTYAEPKAHTSAHKVVAITLYSELNAKEFTAEHELILAVIRNRAKQRRKMLMTICFQRRQFSYWNRYWFGKWFNANVSVIDTEYAKIPTSFIKSLEKKALTDASYGGINHFYSPKSMKPKSKVPSLAKGKKPVYKTKNFEFFAI